MIGAWTYAQRWRRSPVELRTQLKCFGTIQININKTARRRPHLHADILWRAVKMFGDVGMVYFDEYASPWPFDGFLLRHRPERIPTAINIFARGSLKTGLLSVTISRVHTCYAFPAPFVFLVDPTGIAAPTRDEGLMG